MIHTTAYDTRIRAAHTKYKLPYSWTMLKAQLIQESSLNAYARSPAGALGIAQFMPDTWKQYAKKLNFPAGADPTNASLSIIACAAMMRDMYDEWTAERPLDDRYKLSLASYNAGLGNILKAQERAKSNYYSKIIGKLHLVTGAANARQTTDYSVRIFKIYYSIGAV